MRGTMAVPTLVLLAIAAVTTTAAGQEHPEHPMSAPKAATPGLTKDELAQAITSYVAAQEKAHAGTYGIHDPVDGRDLQLKLVNVHRERLARVAPDTYFACADFKDRTGVMYDLDFFMKGAAKDDLAFSDVTVHKKDGKARYTWHEQDGIWKKEPVGKATTPAPAAQRPMEHPGR